MAWCESHGPKGLLSGHRTVRITQRRAESFCQPSSALPPPTVCRRSMCGSTHGALERASHGANHTAAGRKFLPAEQCIAAAYGVSQVHVRIDACALEWASHGANHTAAGRKFLPADAYHGAEACSSPRCRKSMCGSTHVPLSGHRTVRITQRWAERFCQRVRTAAPRLAQVHGVATPCADRRMCPWMGIARCESHSGGMLPRRRQTP